MKIVHVSFAGNGGAGIAARRLAAAMAAAGMDSHLILREDVDFSYGKKTFFRQTAEGLRRFAYARYCADVFAPYRVRGTWSDGTGLLSLVDHPLVSEADVVYLHWINLNSVSIEEVGRLLDTGKKVVWFMHDMWPLTGGCHHAFECNAYRTHCGACPMLTSRREKDLSYQVFERKVKVLENRSNLTLIAPSTWLADCAEKSRLFRGNRIETIPNVIDTEKFRPFEKDEIRTFLNLPKDKKIILFGCEAGTENFYKGWPYLERALEKIGRTGCELVVFGQKKGGVSDGGYPVVIHYLGRINDEFPGMTFAFNAADVFVSPSVAENFSLTLCESSSCGTPSVCFDIGGNSDIILHRQTGYLAKYRDSDDLAAGIEWILGHPDRAGLASAARRHIETLCSAPVVVGKHLKLLRSLI